MNWVDALEHGCEHAQPATTLGPLLASLRPGQQVLYMRPLTEGAQNWKAPWTQLVRRRSAQWGAILAGDPSCGRSRSRRTTTGRVLRRQQRRPVPEGL